MTEFLNTGNYDSKDWWQCEEASLRADQEAVCGSNGANVVCTFAKLNSNISLPFLGFIVAMLSFI